VNGGYGSVAVNGNLMIAVGFGKTAAAAIVGRRTN